MNCYKNKPTANSVKRLSYSIIDKIARNSAKDAIESALLVIRDAFLARKLHQRVIDKTFRSYRNGYNSRTIGLNAK